MKRHWTPVKKTLKKKKKLEESLSILMAQYATRVMKAVWYWQRDSHTVQQNTRENPETDPQKYDF